MKSALILFSALLIPISSMAQEAGRRARIVPRPSSHTTQPAAQPPAPVPRAPVPRPPAIVPAENVTLHFEGSLQGLVDVDVELIGAGPEIRSEFSIPSAEEGMPASIATLRVRLQSEGGRYSADLSVGGRIPIKTSSTTRTNSPKPGAVSYSVEYRDLVLSTRVFLTPGEKVTLSKIGGKKLTILLTKSP